MRRVLCAALIALSATPVYAQRRGAGIRGGGWDVDVSAATNPSQSPYFEGYFQRGVDDHLALENSIGVWRMTTSEPGPIVGSPDVETKTWVVPLLTSLK